MFHMFSELNITPMTSYKMQGRISLGSGVNSVTLIVMFSPNFGIDTCTSDSPVTGVDSIVLAR